MRGSSATLLLWCCSIICGAHPTWSAAASIDEKAVVPVTLKMLSLKEKFEDDLVQGDCAKAWNVLWAVARDGDSEALADLAMAGVYSGLVPPSQGPLSRSALARFRVDNYTALTLYGWRSYLMEMLSEYGLGQPDPLDTTARIRQLELVNGCLTSAADKQSCVEIAVRSGLIPSFQTYVKMIDGAPVPAYCIKLSRPPQRRNSLEAVPLQK